MIIYKCFLFLTDKNECFDSSAKCDMNAICTNTLGSYRCRCQSGYTGDGKTCIGIRSYTDVVAYSALATMLKF